MTKKRSRKKRKRRKQKSTILGALIIEVLAVLVMAGLFVGLRNPPAANNSPVPGSFTSTAYPDTNVGDHQYVGFSDRSEHHCDDCPTRDTALLDQEVPSVAQSRIQWRNPFRLGQR